MVLEGWACRLDPDVHIIPEIARLLAGGTSTADALEVALPEELSFGPG